MVKLRGSSRAVLTTIRRRQALLDTLTPRIQGAMTASLRGLTKLPIEGTRATTTERDRIIAEIMEEGMADAALMPCRRGRLNSFRCTDSAGVLELWLIIRAWHATSA